MGPKAFHVHDCFRECHLFWWLNDMLRQTEDLLLVYFELHDMRDRRDLQYFEHLMNRGLASI